MKKHLIMNVAFLVFAIGLSVSATVIYNNTRRACYGDFRVDTSCVRTPGAMFDLCDARNQSCNDNLKDYRPAYVLGGLGAIFGVLWLVDLSIMLWRRRSPKGLAKPPVMR